VGAACPGGGAAPVVDTWPASAAAAADHGVIVQSVQPYVPPITQQHASMAPQVVGVVVVYLFCFQYSMAPQVVGVVVVWVSLFCFQ
jgi:hypothetical protein